MNGAVVDMNAGTKVDIINHTPGVLHPCYI